LLGAAEVLMVAKYGKIGSSKWAMSYSFEMEVDWCLCPLCSSHPRPSPDHVRKSWYFEELLSEAMCENHTNLSMLPT
jgi:hypothetical protein